MCCSETLAGIASVWKLILRPVSLLGSTDV